MVKVLLTNRSEGKWQMLKEVIRVTKMVDSLNALWSSKTIAAFILKSGISYFFHLKICTMDIPIRVVEVAV